MDNKSKITTYILIIICFILLCASIFVTNKYKNKTENNKNNETVNNNIKDTESNITDGDKDVSNGADEINEDIQNNNDVDEFVNSVTLQGYVDKTDTGYIFLGWLLETTDNDIEISKLENKFVELYGVLNLEEHIMTIKKATILKENETLINHYGILNKTSDGDYQINETKFKSDKNLSEFLDNEVIIQINQYIKNGQEHGDFVNSYPVKVISGILKTSNFSNDTHKHYTVGEHEMHSDSDLDYYIDEEISCIVFESNEGSNIYNFVKFK